jgi:hypothetical protein
MDMKIRTLATAILASLAVAAPVAAPAQAQDKMQEWTAASLKAVLTEMGFKITQDKASATDFSFVASASNGQLPINVYGTRCSAKSGAAACPGADFVTGFKVKDLDSKPVAVSKLTMPGVHGVASGGSVPAVRMEVSVDFSAGLTKDDLKAKVTDYEKTADTAFNTLKAAGLLAD